ncbi:MAG: hypothetical protein WBO12_15930 [Xanthobacteraceae bacterium]
MSNATPTGDITIFTTTKIALSAVIILATAFSASAATKPRITPSEHHIAIHRSGQKQFVRHRAGFEAFALVPRAPAGSVDDSAATGGGSIGYNAGLRANQW